MVNGVIGRAARVVATGLAGAVAYDGVKRIARSGAVRTGLVTGTAWWPRSRRVWTGIRS